jgi:hypothetical protein
MMAARLRGVGIMMILTGEGLPAGSIMIPVLPCQDEQVIRETGKLFCHISDINRSR